MKSNSIITGSLRITFYSEVSFKAEYSLDQKFINKELFITEIRQPLRVQPVLERKKHYLYIRTKKLVIKYDTRCKKLDGRSFQVDYSYDHKYRTWYYGKKDRKNLKGSTLHLFKFPQEVKHRDLSEGVLSRNGFFAHYVDTFVFWNKNRDWAESVDLKNYQMMFFIGYGKDFSAAFKEFSRIFGPAVLPPLWAFGYWYSRYYAYPQDEFKKIVAAYRKQRIPLDVMVIDTDWRENIWQGYDWSKKFFPRPGQAIRELKALGIKIVLNDHPGYNSSEKLPVHDSKLSVINKALHRPLEQAWQCNWADQQEVSLFCDQLLIPKIREGIDAWWVDGWGADGISQNRDFFKRNMNKDPMSLSVKGYAGLNPQLWLNFFYYRSTSRATKKRGVILSRWGGIGSHRYPVWFSGDTYSSWRTLAYQVYFTYTAGNVLTHYWSHDLGGFLGRKISKELYLRWIQFGAFSPVMRTHSDHGVREPWLYDRETLDCFRKYTQLRYALIPYFYSCAYTAYLEGKPLFRALYHNYPEDQNAYRYKYQYLIGDSIMAAPVVQRSFFKNTRKKIYFPEGEWLGLENNYMTMGRSTQVLQVPLTEIPLFIRKGAIIPVAREEKYIGAGKRNYLHFEVFPGEKSTFTYYEDDGLTEDYKKNRFIRIPVTVSRSGKELKVVIGTLSGNYQGYIKKRFLDLVLHFPEDVTLITARSRGKILKCREISQVFRKIDSLFNSFQVSTVYQGRVLEIIFHIE